MLDGFNEISPDYTLKVEMLIKGIMNKIALKLWVSSCFSYQMKLENITMKFAFTLRPSTKENQIIFLELLRLSSKNFSDKGGQFTGIPLQTMMLGEAFVKEAENYCSSGKVNLTPPRSEMFIPSWSQAQAKEEG
jgi:hypothetical protein